MEVVRARSAKEFLRLISPSGKLFSCAMIEHIFRGQSDARWPVLPSALRAGTVIPYEGRRRTCPLESNREQIYAELDMMRQFGRTLNRAGHHVPCDDVINASAYPLRYLEQGNKLGRGEAVWPPREYHSLIALAQHNGLPTRFIDFTYNPYVAAYFAARGARDWSSRSGYSGEISVHALADLHVVRSYEYRPSPWGELLGEKKDGYCYQLIEAPSYFNAHLRAQRACFLAYLQFAPSANEPCEVHSLEEFVAAATEENLRPPYPFQSTRLYQITLRSTFADELLALLHRHDIDASSIFPNIAGCVASMYERSSEQGKH